MSPGCQFGRVRAHTPTPHPDLPTARDRMGFMLVSADHSGNCSSVEEQQFVSCWGKMSPHLFASEIRSVFFAHSTCLSVTKKCGDISPPLHKFQSLLLPEPSEPKCTGEGGGNCAPGTDLTS